jgi:hypothetical protein
VTLIRLAVESLNASLKATAGETVTYRRGNQTIDGLIAVPANTRHDEYGAEEFNFSGREKDWIYWAADLWLDGLPLVPQRGDAIDWIDPQGVKHTYEVLPRTGDRVFRHTDPSQQQLRVYCVEKLPAST